MPRVSPRSCSPTPEPPLTSWGRETPQSHPARRNVLTTLGLAKLSALSSTWAGSSSSTCTPATAPRVEFTRTLEQQEAFQALRGPLVPRAFLMTMAGGAPWPVLIGGQLAACLRGLLPLQLAPIVGAISLAGGVMMMTVTSPSWTWPNCPSTCSSPTWPDAGSPAPAGVAASLPAATSSRAAPWGAAAFTDQSRVQRSPTLRPVLAVRQHLFQGQRRVGEQLDHGGSRAARSSGVRHSHSMAISARPGKAWPPMCEARASHDPLPRQVAAWIAYPTHRGAW